MIIDVCIKGLTGSGKTTALDAAIKALSDAGFNVIPRDDACYHSPLRYEDIEHNGKYVAVLHTEEAHV